MSRLMRQLIFAITCLFAVPLANADTFYVSNSGNDNNDGRSLNTAWATLQYAADSTNVKAGDTIEVAAGTYHGFGIGNRRGISWNPGGYITIHPYNNGAVTIQGDSSAGGVVSVATPGCASDPAYGIRAACFPSFWWVEGFNIDGSGVHYAVKFESGGIRLIRNKIHESDADVVKLVATSDDVTISENEIFNSGRADGNAQGIDIVGAKDTVIRYNYIHDIRSIGVYPKGNAEDTIVEHNKLERIHQHGIQLGHPTTAIDMRYQGDPNYPYETYRARVRNNIIVGADHACIGIANGYEVKVYNNSCYNTASAAHAGLYFSNESEHPAHAPSRYVEVKNNIFHVTGYRVVVVAEDGTTPPAIDESTVSIDNNVYFMTTGPARFEWDRKLGSDIGTFDVWKQHTGYDNASIEQNPDYADTSELRLNSTSPAIDRGTNSLCDPTDYREQTVRPQNGVCDIGADEVAGTPPSGDSVAPTASMTAPSNGSTVSGVITLSADANDNVGVVGVQFLVDGNPVGAEDTTANPYSISFDTSTLTPGSHSFSARARDAAGNVGNAAAVTATVQTGGTTGSCTHADAGQWQNTAFAAQAGNFTAQWDAKPLADNIDSLHALTLGAQTSWTGLAAIVRFNSTGTIDARNGAGYGAAANIPYSANNVYHIRTVVNVPAKTYSVYVTPPGGAEQLLAQNYAFRTEQQGVASLDNFVVEAEVGSSEACGFSVAADTSGGGTPTGQVVTWENSDTSHLTYSPLGTGLWSLNGSDSNASNGDYAVGNGAGAQLSFSFIGTEVQWIAFMDQYSGQARVTIDGASEIVDLYRAYGTTGFGWQQLAWQKTGLAYGTHNVLIEVLGTKNANSADVGVSVDAFKIKQ